MVPNKWGIRLVMAGMFFLAVLACSSPSELFVAEATVTPTRTPRPTFTPLPKPTDLPTVMPTLPPPPTSAPATQISVKATVKPTSTKVPTAKPAATKVPATQAPVIVQPTVPPPPPPTAAPRFDYAANPASCVHAGNQYIKGKVYDSSDPSANGVPGLKMALGGADGANAWVTTNNESDGFYTFTLSTPGGGTKPAGAYYVWILDKSGKRISDVGGPINLNPVGPDAGGVCWAGNVDFWKR